MFTANGNNEKSSQMMPIDVYSHYSTFSPNRGSSAKKVKIICKKRNSRTGEVYSVERTEIKGMTIN